MGNKELVQDLARAYNRPAQAYADMRQGEIDTWDEMRSLAGETDMEEEAEQLGWDQYEDLDLDKLWEPRDEDGHTAPIEGEDPDWGLQELLGESEDPSET